MLSKIPTHADRLDGPPILGQGMVIAQQPNASRATLGQV